MRAPHFQMPHLHLPHLHLPHRTRSDVTPRHQIPHRGGADVALVVLVVIIGMALLLAMVVMLSNPANYAGASPEYPTPVW